VKEAVEVAEKLKNSTLLIVQKLCQEYLSENKARVDDGNWLSANFCLGIFDTEI